MVPAFPFPFSFSFSLQQNHNLGFASVFNVTDQDGNKITDEGVLDYIEKVCNCGN